MSFCVNIKSKEFIDASQRLDIHPSQLESIIHEYINQEGVSADSFPSDDYILSKTKGKEGVAVSEAQYKLWERDFSKPASIDIATPLNEELNYIYQFFPKEMVGVRETNDGGAIITVAKPTIKSKVEKSSKNVVYNVTKIISGGQTGVDTIGLQIGRELGIETGGTAPKGYLREKGVDNEDIASYGLVEITEEQARDYTSRTGKRDPYTGRTELNVRNSDGTVYFSTSEDSAGMIATKRSAAQWNKPFLENPTSEELAKWIINNNIKTLNVAGNRGSKLNNPEEIRNIIKKALSQPIQDEIESQTFLTKEGKINWDYFEKVLNDYHNSQPDSQFAKGRYTLRTREEKHFAEEKNTLNHIKFVTQSMLDLFEGKFDADLPFVSEARASLKNQRDLMILAAMFHDTAKPYRHGDIHGWESADILRDILGIDYKNALAEWAVRHHMPMPFSHKAEFNLSNPEALEVAKNIARDALRLGIDKNTAINAFVLINAADIINGREITVEDNWAKKALAKGTSRYGEDISIKNVLSIELNEKVELLKKAFDDVKDESFGDVESNYYNQTRFDYTEFPEEGRTDGKLPYLSETKKESTNQQFANQSQDLITQINNLLDNEDSPVGASEVRHLAEQVVYWISDRITDYLDNPEVLFINFPEKKTNISEPPTKEDIDKVKNMTRAEVARFVGPQNLITLCKESLFNTANNTNITTDHAFDVADIIYDNFMAVVRLAADVMSTIEDFSMNVTEKGIEINEEVNIDADNFNTSNEESNIQENEGNQQEHWQVEFRTQEILSSMSQLVKQQLTKCYQLKEVEKLNPETGELEIVYEKVLSEFGVAERVDARDATQSILRWTQGSLTLGDMITKLKAKAKDNPWIQQIIDRLSDNSGKESDFQSQFFGVFQKHFQPYSIVLKEDGQYKSIAVNEHPALTDIMSGIIAQYNIGEHPMFTSDGVNVKTLETLEQAYTELSTLDKDLAKNNRQEIIANIGIAANTLGYYITPEMVDAALNQTSFNTMKNYLMYITKSLRNAVGKDNYDPFKFKGDNNIKSNLQKFLQPLTDILEDTAVSSFYDSGKMYQSYVTPSYMTKLMNKFHEEDPETFRKFIEEEYGNYEWFRMTKDSQGNAIPVNKASSWRNVWLRDLLRLPAEERKEVFKHKVQLNFNKHNYMRNMSDAEYLLSIITEYFSEPTDNKQTRQYAWFRIPMLSNKPSSEFIKFFKYTGVGYQDSLVDGFHKIFLQELSRIQTVEMRNYDKKDSRHIKNFDTNGKKFNFLDFLNPYIGKQASGQSSLQNTELGQLITNKLKGNEVNEARLEFLIKKEIKDAINNKANTILKQWEAQGIFEGVKQIQGVGKEKNEIENALREFIWNDTFAAMNILQLTVTDIAYYKDAEDLQKRLAQIHSPGIRGNKDVVDYNGKPVTDGKERTIYLTDFDDFISNIIENVSIVFDRKINQAKTEQEKAGLKALKENLVGENGAFRQINVADAQGYSSPTSYRKKAYVFGKWSRQAEDIYQKLIKGEYTYNDLQTAFQPLKPFVYSQISKQGSEGLDTPLSTLKVPVQNKNSEYLLIMADAILQGEDTGRPNLLRAIYEVMEESHYDKNGNYKTNGIDTVQFESTVKSGLMGRINIKQFSNDKGGEAAAKIAMIDAIYNADGTYNSTFVHEIPFEDYCLQQEVPEHFKEHEQAHGSQIRYIIPSDLESVDYLGNEVRYTFMDKGKEKSLTADEFKKEYENNIAENIYESIEELSTELGIGNLNISRKDKNIALAKILQREILSSPRYGVDLLQACSVDADGNFRIPLGDPIQSKRVEQLINSIIKNRVNKQTIAGGPVVQVTNFGTSKELNIRFKDKEGNLLQTRKEFNGTDAEYRNYIKENQAGIAYFEVFAPIYSNELFQQFADKDGNIDIETIERVNPDLLKMVGYRIPTEDKYSMAPLKIVGFLPREAGDGIMLPNDITLLTGSDFDVDKFYLMRKELNIARRFTNKAFTSDQFAELNEAEQDYIKRNSITIENYIFNKIKDEVNLQKAIKLDSRKKKDIEETIDNKITQKIDSINKLRETSISTLTERFNQLSEANENNLEDQQLEKADTKLENWYEKKLAKINEKYDSQIQEVKNSRNEQIFDLALKEVQKEAKSVIKEVLANPHAKYKNEFSKAIKNIYIDYMYSTIENTSGRTYRNNKIVDMTYAVLTHETTADKMLNPGGFDQQKKMGYMVAAFKNPANNYTWEKLQAMSISELKDACYTEKNLSFIDTHVQFYKQNSAAGQILGMFAVQKVAHAVLESNGYLLNVNAICKLGGRQPFTIAGMEFGGYMEFDMKYNNKNELIGKILGSLVASAADAVKDPILNLMNINGQTANVLNTLVRLGMSFENAALLLSNNAISEALEEYNTENLTNFVRLSDIIEKRKQALADKYKIEEDSQINTEELTLNELINGLKSNLSEAEKAAIDYKVLKAYQRIQSIADAMKGPTYATRFNSISNAVGPLIIDNLIMEHKMQNFSEYILQRKTIYKTTAGTNIKLGDLIFNGEFEEVLTPELANKLIADEVLIQEYYYDSISMDNIFNAHPILREFSKAPTIADELFGNMPANSRIFRNVLDSLNNDLQNIIYGDRKLLSTLSDFFQSYLLVASGVINSKDLKAFIETFPKTFNDRGYKTKYANNPLIAAIKLDTIKVNKKTGQKRAVLKIDTTGMTPQQKEKLMSGWIDLHKVDPKLSESLFKYNFFRTGIGFSPKSFMGLVPVFVKEKLKGYNDTFKSLPTVDPELVIDQFIRNNWDNNKLVPRKKDLKYRALSNTSIEITDTQAIKSIEKSPYIKIKIGKQDMMFRRKFLVEDRAVYDLVSPLGNNKEYLEISTDKIAVCLNTPTVANEQNDNTDISENTPQQVDLDIPSETTPTTEEQRAISEDIIAAYMTKGRDRESAIAKIKSFKDRTEIDKARWKSGIIGFLRKRYTELGIKFDETKLEEDFKSMC